MALKPRTTMTLLLSVSAIVYAVLLLLPGGIGAGKLIGKPAPELHFEIPEVGRSALSEFKGQVVLLNFWAEWCVPCLEEMPSLKQLEQKLDAKRFVLIALNVDGEKARGTLEVLGKQLPKNSAFSTDEKEVDAYGVSALPYSVLIDAEGRVRKTFIGSRDWVKPALVQEIQQYFLIVYTRASAVPPACYPGKLLPPLSMLLAGPSLKGACFGFHTSNRRPTHPRNGNRPLCG